MDACVTISQRAPVKNMWTLESRRNNKGGKREIRVQEREKDKHQSERNGEKKKTATPAKGEILRRSALLQRE